VAPGRRPDRLGHIPGRCSAENAAPATALLSRFPHYLLPGRPLGTARPKQPGAPCRTSKTGAPEGARGRARTSSQPSKPHGPRRESERPHVRAESRCQRRSRPRRALGRHRTRPPESPRGLDFRRRSTSRPRPRPKTCARTATSHRGCPGSRRRHRRRPAPPRRAKCSRRRPASNPARLGAQNRKPLRRRFNPRRRHTGRPAASVHSRHRRSRWQPRQFSARGWFPSRPPAAVRAGRWAKLGCADECGPRCRWTGRSSSSQPAG